MSELRGPQCAALYRAVPLVVSGVRLPLLCLPQARPRAERVTMSTARIPDGTPQGLAADPDPAPGLWVCYCGEVAPWSWSFPHWDCQGGRPLSLEA